MTAEPLAVDYTTSDDGTRIGYNRIGSGPGLVLVQGAMGTAYSFRELAEALSDSFTVVVPDRRGRGMSPHRFSAEYSIDDDVRDLQAVMSATGAGYVYGLSAGGDIVLRAAASLPAIEKLAVFEPALFDHPVPSRTNERFARYAANSDRAGMLVTGMKAGEFGPSALRSMPDSLIKPLVRRIMRKEAEAGSGEYASMAELADAFKYDFAIVNAVSGSTQDFDAIMQPVLLIGASDSPRYLQHALDVLEQAIPNTRRVLLEGLDHAASWNVDQRRNPRGNPVLVAQHLTEFFSAG